MTDVIYGAVSKQPVEQATNNINVEQGLQSAAAELDNGNGTTTKTKRARRPSKKESERFSVYRFIIK